MRRRLSADQIKRILEMSEQGNNRHQIANELGFSFSTVEHHIGTSEEAKRYGLEYPSDELSAAKKLLNLKRAETEVALQMSERQGRSANLGKEKEIRRGQSSLLGAFPRFNTRPGNAMMIVNQMPLHHAVAAIHGTDATLTDESTQKNYSKDTSIFGIKGLGRSELQNVKSSTYSCGPNNQITIEMIRIPKFPDLASIRISGKSETLVKEFFQKLTAQKENQKEQKRRIRVA